MAVPAVRKVRDDLLVVSWREPTNLATNTIEIKLDVDSSNVWSLKYEGHGTQNVNLELKPVSLVLQQPTSIYVIIGEQLQKMEFLSCPENVWRVSFTNVKVTYDFISGTTYRVSPFCFEVLFDFKPPGKMYIEEGELKVLANLSHLFQDQALADITFKVMKETIKAHSIIVSAGSPVLLAIIQQDFLEKQTKIVEIKDTKPDIFRQLLMYLYTGQCSDLEKEGVARDLLVAADKYGVESLKEKCALFLIKNLKVENATHTLIVAHLHSSHELYKATLDFMSQHGRAICSRSDWMDLIKNFPALCFQATQLIAMH